jgi:hypothetical protein
MKIKKVTGDLVNCEICNKSIPADILAVYTPWIYICFECAKEISITVFSHMMGELVKETGS